MYGLVEIKHAIADMKGVTYRGKGISAAAAKDALEHFAEMRVYWEKGPGLYQVCANNWNIGLMTGSEVIELAVNLLGKDKIKSRSLNTYR